MKMEYCQLVRVNIKWFMGFLAYAYWFWDLDARSSLTIRVKKEFEGGTSVDLT